MVDGSEGPRKYRCLSWPYLSCDTIIKGMRNSRFVLSANFRIPLRTSGMWEGVPWRPWKASVWSCESGGQLNCSRKHISWICQSVVTLSKKSFIQGIELTLERDACYGQKFRWVSGFWTYTALLSFCLTLSPYLLTMYVHIPCGYNWNANSLPVCVGSINMNLDIAVDYI